MKDHLLWVDAEDYTPTDGPDPAREIRPVEGTHLDFREAREIGDARLDQNLVLRPGRDTGKPAARAECPRTGATLELWTAEPGLQLFNASGDDDRDRRPRRQRYGPYAGLCLEAQHFPDSLHHPDWPSIVRPRRRLASSGWRWRSRAR